MFILSRENLGINCGYDGITLLLMAYILGRILIINAYRIRDIKVYVIGYYRFL
jgi:hypothetical protein